MEQWDGVVGEKGCDRRGIEDPQPRQRACPGLTPAQLGSIQHAGILMLEEERPVEADIAVKCS